MASSASSQFKPEDDESKLDDLVSELHALKKLYGLLQNNSARPARPDLPTVDMLDEKSRRLLRKLLDGATQQALQFQAKKIFCTPESLKSQAQLNTSASNNDLQKKAPEAKRNQEREPTLPPESSPEAAKSTPGAQTKITHSPCPITEPTSHKHRRSEYATVLRSRANDSASLDRRIMRKSVQPSEKGSRRVLSIRSGGSDLPPSSEKDGEVLAMVPVQKRARVEPLDLPSRATLQTQKPDQDDRVLTHQKRASRKQLGPEPSSIRTMQRTHSSKRQSSRSLIPSGDRIVQRNDQLPDSKTRVTSNKHKKQGRLNRSKANTLSSSSKESTESISDSTRSTTSIPLNLQKHNKIKTKTNIAPPPQPPQPTLSNRIARRSQSRHLSFRSQTTPTVQGNKQSIENKSRAKKPIKPARPNRSRARRRCSSSSNSTRSTQPGLLDLRKQSRGRTRGRRGVPPLASLKPPIPHHLAASKWKPPTSRSARTRMEKKQKEEENEHGKIKKLSNKLAIIFHHHHHHHHHLHAGEDDEGGGGGNKDHEKSIWKYLKGFLHVNKGSGVQQGKLHGHNFRVLMGWFLHHLWWTRQRRSKKVERPRLAKKVKWWDWFRRKRGVAVGERPKLRLGLKGSHRRAGERKE
ncbi:serine/arginine repetitive matrix protein 2-like [Dendrobium catenatum]|uniref:Uncharacterized protein n=1 Tax=Dendrobium catenatum TaxID=906689 RepID=A0A2I0WWZ1_9ASPA|nr:serine/arginine repetitive matrix protein 2-like [Dendrobium catenatum]PKU80172.1 hypothetical protein MA16_Dca023367 [Dendrobium catenatum]